MVDRLFVSAFVFEISSRSFVEGRLLKFCFGRRFNVIADEFGRLVDEPLVNVGELDGRDPFPLVSFVPLSISFDECSTFDVSL